MRIVFSLAFLALALSGCGACSRTIAIYTGYDTVCVEGIKYIQFASGATHMVDTDGKPVRCDK
jgi:hypothetical protein